MARHIALLRGINVGRGRKVEMARLRELVERLGYADARTYVQSGNVVFTAKDEPAAAEEEALEAAIAKEFGLEVPVIVRSREELDAIVRADPLADVATDPKRHHVLFLKRDVDPARLAEVPPEDFAPERYVHDGREIHLWTPDGIGTSRLARALSDTRLGGVATARNWRTVDKLRALAGEGD